MSLLLSVSAILHETCGVASISLSENGRFALVNVIRPPELHLWDLGPMEESEQPASAASASPLPVAPPTLIRRFTGFHANRFIVRSCFAGPSSSLLVSGSEDGLVYVWAREGSDSDRASASSSSDGGGAGQPLAKLRGHTATVNSVAAVRFQERHLLASAADDHTVLLWSLHSQVGHSHQSQHKASAASI